ncbi:sensor histidine kinase [Thiomonas intermedia]|uniref:sensor histidine kinase n=1 Tax=Thiomonas intermedia TaxID=926 RepID=UPI001FE6E71F|nr:sensor histidine kinase [Thiomonas intermedia]
MSSFPTTPKADAIDGDAVPASAPAPGVSRRLRPIRWISGLFGRLYWRTFLLIVLLVSASLATWFQSFRLLELGPQVEQTSRQITSLIDLTRLALIHSDPQYRVSLLDDLAKKEGIYIYPRNPGDLWTPMNHSEFTRRLETAVDTRLNEQLDFADAVNDRPGLWIGFQIEGDPYWLLLDRSRIDPSLSETWATWGAIATLLALIGAAVIASFVNKPLRDLRLATARVGAGNYSQMLDELSGMREIREVNRGFNRMARSLQEVEEERALMLAGISHDIRTPLARLRLEAELSVPDEQAREHIIDDIEQADRIISKFLEYARSTSPKLETVDLNALLDFVHDRYQKDETVVLRLQTPPVPPVRANTLELQRVVVNLVENAKRYALTPEEVHTDLDISLQPGIDSVLLTVRDHGPGVPDEQLAQLTRPFFRGDAARTSAKGTGLGLSIVEKTITAMGGRLELRNAVPNGLQVQIWLPLAGSTAS